MNRALLIDFEDSFTFNVVAELELVGFSVEVQHWKDFEPREDVELLVAGPGPGHPDDYQQIFPELKKWLELKKPFFGVCLGHQLFWRLRDELVVRSKLPLHGQKVTLYLDESWRLWLGIKKEVQVQRYNSLCVTSQGELRNPDLINFIQDDEILITRGEKVLTYQFHPESVGTCFRHEFMKALYSIL